MKENYVVARVSLATAKEIQDPQTEEEMIAFLIQFHEPIRIRGAVYCMLMQDICELEMPARAQLMELVRPITNVSGLSSPTIGRTNAMNGSDISSSAIN